MKNFIYSPNVKNWLDFRDCVNNNDANNIIQLCNETKWKFYCRNFSCPPNHFSRDATILFPRILTESVFLKKSFQIDSRKMNGKIVFRRYLWVIAGLCTTSCIKHFSPFFLCCFPLMDTKWKSVWLKQTWMLCGGGWWFIIRRELSSARHL